ncbi:MAG: hypothetical protein MJ173_08160 [Clostridia bacterium]|nr:hypothetical protein [Clostridia bacterium]
MKKNKTFKLTSAAIMLAVIIIMQLLKNISAYISGPVINAVMAIAALELGITWGIGFSVIVPIMSLIVAPASPMSALSAATHYVTIPVIIIGNIIFVAAAKLGSKKGNLIFIVSLIIGAVLKWLFMWGCGELILIPVFSESLGKLSTVITKVFSTLQLYSGLLGIILIIPADKAIKKVSLKK